MHYLIVPSIAIALIFFAIMTVFFWVNLRKANPKPIRYSFLLSGVVLILTHLEFLGASLFVYYYESLLVPGLALAIISFMIMMILFCRKLRKPYLKLIPICGFLLLGVVLLLVFLGSLGLSSYFIIPGAIFAVISFVIQIIFCFKFRKPVLKLIPVYGFLLAGLLILLIYFGLYGKSIGNGGFLNTFDFLALVLACELGIAFIGNILAWVVWGMICGIRKLIRMRRK